jgi:hypothetical protein
LATFLSGKNNILILTKTAQAIYLVIFFTNSSGNPAQQQ